MKKTLIATTALIAAGMLASPASAAEKIKLSVGGFMENWVGFSSQQSAFEQNAATTTIERNYNDIDVQQDSEITFSGSTKLDNGITVKAVLEYEADRGSTGNDTVAVYLSSPSMGEVQIGATVHTHGGALVEAPDVGIDRTDADNWVVNPGNSANERPFVARLDDTQKIGYKSPSFGGLQIMGAYQPENDATNNAVQDMNAGNGSEYGVGGKWSGKFGGTSVNAGLLWHRQEAQASGGDNSQITGGVSVSMSGITVGGAYSDYDQDNANSVTTSVNGDFYNVGVSYKAGPTSVSLSYAHGETEGLVATAADDERSIIMLSAGYNMGPGIDMKASLFQAEYIDEAKTSATKNKGWGLVAGVDLAF